MDLNAFESAIREVAYVAVLTTGCAVLVFGCCATIIWGLRSLARLLVGAGSRARGGRR